MNAELILTLEKKIDDLIILCDQLQQENRQLKANQSDLEEEHEQLQGKNEQARGRVDNMIPASDHLRKTHEPTP
jgi:cell division protein ZapB